MKDINEHKLFNDNFEFTLDQIVEMGNDNKELDELYNDQKYRIGLSALKDDHEKAKFNMEYMANKSNYKVVKQLLYVLAFFPSGMTLYDINQLNETQT